MSVTTEDLNQVKEDMFNYVNRVAGVDIGLVTTIENFKKNCTDTKSCFDKKFELLDNKIELIFTDNQKTRDDIHLTRKESEDYKELVKNSYENGMVIIYEAKKETKELAERLSSLELSLKEHRHAEKEQNDEIKECLAGLKESIAGLLEQKKEIDAVKTTFSMNSAMLKIGAGVISSILIIVAGVSAFIAWLKK